MVGQNLAHYKILEKIGSGGMGAVYLAKDTKLDRNVALKILPPELAENEERRSRFTREAKAIAALNHPNIVTVYSVEEADSIHFITMEHVEGKTLAAALPRHGFSLGQFLDLAIPLVDAVAAAHEHGITHRDLKPHNIIVSAEGRVKVLDFGLAKPSARLGSAASDSELPTEQMTRGGADSRDCRLYVSRTGGRKGRRCPIGHLRAGCEFLRNADRRAAVSGRYTGVDTLCRHQGRGAVDDGARAVPAARHGAHRQTVPGKRSVAPVPNGDRRAQRARGAREGPRLGRDDGGSGPFRPFAFFVACAPVDSHSGGRTARCPMVERHHSRRRSESLPAQRFQRSRMPVRLRRPSV